MITAKDFRAAFVDLIRNKANISYDIYFNGINKSDTSYVWVNFIRARKTSWDNAYFQWNISVDIQVILISDDYAEVRYTDLWDISDSLTKAIKPYIKIKDRFVTIQDFDSSIVDDILHYEFDMNFTDYVPSAEYEETEYDLMKELEMELSIQKEG